MLHRLNRRDAQTQMSFKEKPHEGGSQQRHQGRHQQTGGWVHGLQKRNSVKPPVSSSDKEKIEMFHTRIRTALEQSDKLSRQKFRQQDSAAKRQHDSQAKASYYQRLPKRSSKEAVGSQ